MIWLTWRQFRAEAMMLAAALAVFAAVLGLTGPGLAEEYSTGIAACTTQSDGCSDFVQQFFADHRNAFLGVTAVVLVLPALIGLFWGAPLLARELEAGTHRLVWNQSITRRRWLTVKLALPGSTAMIAAGLGSLVVTWWASPVDKAATEDFPRLDPLMFATRGIVPIGYAAFAFALGVAIGMLVRRTLPAMAITLAVFVAVQIAMPLLVRPHLLPSTQSTSKVTAAHLAAVSRDDGDVRLQASVPDAWILSTRTVDAKGQAVSTISLPASSMERCEPALEEAARIGDCVAAEITRLGYRLEASYLPSSRFWPLQWAETGIYLGLALGLAGGCSSWVRRRLT